MKKSAILSIALLTTSTAAAETSDNEMIHRFFAVTHHAAIETVNNDEASNLYYKFCSTAGEFHYKNHSSVRNSINFDGTRDFRIRCNLLNSQRGTAAAKGVVCVGNTKILNERDDFIEVTSRKRIEILPSAKATCGPVKRYDLDRSDDVDYEVFEDSVFTIVSLF